MYMIYPTVFFVILMSVSVTYAVESRSKAVASVPGKELSLTLRQALDAVVDNNPTVRLAKERIEAAKGQTLTQLGGLLPNLSSTVRQSEQTIFLGTLGLAPVRTAPFSIFDARATASQSIFSLNLIQRW